LIEVGFARDIDFTIWDEYVNNHPNGTPYHRIAWNSAISDAYRHRTFYLLAKDSNCICGILPLCLIKPPLLPGILCGSPYCDVGGVLANDNLIKKKLINKGLELADDLGKISLLLRERHIEYINSDYMPEDLQGKKVSMILKLPESSDILLASFKSKLRSQIKKAVKNGLVFESGRNKQQIDDFYDVFTQNMRKLGSPTHSYKWFEQLRTNYNRDLIIGVVKYNKVVIGAGMVISSNGTSFIPWASTILKYNRLAPNMLLYWNLIKYACDSGSNHFDFGRSTYGEGTYNFKKQWGTTPLPLLWTTYSASGNIEINTSSYSRTKNIAEKAWSHLPLILTKKLGPLTRKYISL
jgi:FemAB-related protein (PEP-CTERM system-associated)